MNKCIDKQELMIKTWKILRIGENQKSVKSKSRRAKKGEGFQGHLNKIIFYRNFFTVAQENTQKLFSVSF